MGRKSWCGSVVSTVIGGAAALAALATTTNVMAHVDDPKMKDRVPPYDGPGYRAALDGPAAAAPVGFPALGITLRSWVPLSELGLPQNGADCWGYTSPSGGEYAIMCTYSGTAFIDVTDPDNAVVLDVIDGPDSLWSDVKVYDQYAYAVTEGSGAGIQVFDLSAIDSGVVTLANTINTGGTTSTHNVAINEASGYLYRAGGTTSTGMRVYSLANPAAPAFVGEWNARYIHDLQVVTYTDGPYAGREIAYCCTGFNGGHVETGFEILDVTNKSSIVSMGRIVYPNGEYSHQVWTDPTRTYAYLNDELDENGSIRTKTFIFDITDLSNPSLVSTFANDSTAVGHNLYVHEGLIYEANYRSGLRVFDARDPEAPVEIAYFDTWPSDDGASFNGLWSVYPYFESGTVIGSDFEKGLFVWTIDNPLVAIEFPGGVPEYVNPNGDVIEVAITELEPDGFLPGTAQFHYSTGESYASAPMTAFGEGFQAIVPPVPCGEIVDWYISAQTSDGSTVTSPVAAPNASYESTAALGVDISIDQTMESTNGYFVTNVDLSDGEWMRGVPAGDGDRGDPVEDYDGSGACWLTDNVAGNSDVDGGPTRLTSDMIDLTALADPVVRYAWWFSNDDLDSDTLVGEISNDGGATWTTLASHAPNTGWNVSTFRVSDYVTPTAFMRMRFSATDNPNNSVTEAAIDALQVFEYVCAADVPGDVDGNGIVDFSDLLATLAAWGACGDPCPADFDGNAVVDFNDLLTVLAAWSN